MAKFLDGVGLSRVWTRMKSYIANTNYNIKAEVDAILATIPSRMRYRGNCLYDAVTNTPGEFESIDAIQAAVSNGDFSNIFIGDYILVQITTQYTTNETVKLLVADIDYYLNRSTVAATNHHLVLIPENSFEVTQSMENDVASTSYGYKSSEMQSLILPKYATALSSSLSGHLLSISFQFSSSTNTSAQNDTGGMFTGVSSNSVEKTTNISLMTETQVYNTKLYSNLWDLGYGTQQLALFTLRPDFISCGVGYNSSSKNSWWLSGVASKSAYCVVAMDGSITWSNANSIRGVRPHIMFG